MNNKLIPLTGNHTDLICYIRQEYGPILVSERERERIPVKQAASIIQFLSMNNNQVMLRCTVADPEGVQGLRLNPLPVSYKNEIANSYGNLYVNYQVVRTPCPPLDPPRFFYFPCRHLLDIRLTGLINKKKHVQKN